MDALGLKTVSKYSFYSNQRATGKVNALINWMSGIENKKMTVISALAI